MKIWTLIVFLFAFSASAHPERIVRGSASSGYAPWMGPIVDDLVKKLERKADQNAREKCTSEVLRLTEYQVTEAMVMHRFVMKVESFYVCIEGNL